MTTLTCFAVARLARTFAGRARLVMVGLLVFGLAFSPGVVQASHVPDRPVAGELTRHADLGAEAISSHGHSHEDGDVHERGPGHLTGHDPADHSHQFAFTPPAGVQPHRSIGQTWVMRNQTALRLGPDSGLERPPKRVLLT